MIRYVYNTADQQTLQNNHRYGVLQFAGQEEGRIRFKPATNTTTADFAYDYFIKDHLGNVRMVLTEEAQADQYPAASMEDAAATAEETYYSNLNTTRVASPSGYPANTPAGNAKVARVSGGTNPADHKIGPAILLKVMSGDKFNVSVNSWWKKDAGTPVNSPNSAGAGLLEALINGVSGLGGSKFTPIAAYHGGCICNRYQHFFNTTTFFHGYIWQTQGFFKLDIVR